ncbi:MAG TPA: hypothetical protein VGM56_21000, partial [Byssovorax sp.]
MSRTRSASLEYVAAKPGEPQGHYRARVTLDGGSRPWVDLKPSPKSRTAEARARERALAWAEKQSAAGTVVVPRKGSARDLALRAEGAETV